MSITYSYETEKITMNKSTWIADTIKSISSTTGNLVAKDSTDSPIHLSWELINPKSERLNEIIREVSDILVQTYVVMELQFAQKYPDTIASQMFLKPLDPLFKDGVDKVDWQKAQEILQKHLQQFFSGTDFAQYSNADDIQLFVIAKEAKTKVTLGLIQFLITAQFPYGTVKIAFFGVDSSAHNRGIEQLLMSSIFKLIPSITKIFLHTRVTNEQALGMYRALGFVPCGEQSPFWTEMEYLVGTSNTLQQLAMLIN